MTETRPIEPEALRDALGGERPDPEAFLAGVRERLDARASTPPRTLTPIPPRWRWAASLLPPGIIPMMTAGGSVGVKLSWKALPGLAALPGIAFVMIVASFFGGLRQLRKLDDEALDSKAEDAARVRHAWWMKHRKKAFLGIAGIVALAYLGSPSAALFVVLGSMVALVLLVGALAREGYANRESVMRMCIGVLYTNALCWWTAHDMLPRAELGPQGFEFAMIFVLGIVLCALAGGRLSWAGVKERVMYPVRMRHPDRITVVCLRCLSIPVAFVAAAGLLAWLLYLPLMFMRPAGTWSETRQAEATRELADWVRSRPDSELLNAGAMSVARGVAELDPELAPRLFAPSLLDRIAAGEAFSWAHAQDFVGLGLVEPEDLPEHLERWARRDLFEDRGPLIFEPEAVLVSTAALESGAVSESTVQDWCDRIVAGWNPRESKTLVDDLEVVRWLEALGCTDAVRAKGPELRARLQSHWRARASQFVRDPDEGFFSGILGGSTIFQEDVELTRAAIGLMQRVGVPEGIDPAALRKSIAVRRGLRIPGFSGIGDGYSGQLEALSVLARVELDRAFPEPPLRWYEHLWELRQFLATVLLITLCVISIRRAPVVREVEA
jgi:hypothetical protein